MNGQVVIGIDTERKQPPPTPPPHSYAQLQSLKERPKDEKHDEKSLPQ